MEVVLMQMQAFKLTFVLYPPHQKEKAHVDVAIVRPSRLGGLLLREKLPIAEAEALADAMPEGAMRRPDPECCC
jgi:hypothetical protein